MQEQSRALEFPDLLNARDLGGYPTTDGAHTRWRSLLRADDLSQLNAAGLAALADYGVRTVLDLRWPEEATRHPSPLPAALPAVRYTRISLLTHTEDEWRLRSRDAAKELWKCAVLEHVRHELHHVLSFIAAAPPEPLLFHCVAGKDRTGLIAALLLALADATPEAIAHDYSASSENLREGYLRRYADAEPQRVLDALRCPEEGAYNMLAFLERSGGVRAYLAQIGLRQDEIERLRARLRS
ncbi:MAG TPA: tyrosine-protein phosphatase [Steroidobacteraceae bacterium]|nr:tyrosine-protein phosphatase [Steroidobacteraceae bacterium]